MTYPRVVERNHLVGHYAHPEDFSWRRLLSGDLRRLERDSRDQHQLARVAATAGVSPAKALAVLSAFFGDCNTTPQVVYPWLGSEPHGPRPPRVIH